MTFLRMSTSSITIIFFIILIRLIAMHKLPKRTFLVLWSIVLCRLLIPILIPSKWSLYTFLYQYKKAEISGGYSNQLISQFTDFSILNLFKPLLQNPTANWILILIWLAGFLISTSIFIIPYTRRVSEYRSALPVKNDIVDQWLSEQKTKVRFEIRQSDMIASPISYGILKPVILLPKTVDWSDTVALNYILTHEYIHIKTSDIILKWLATAALCIHWFNPAVWLMYSLVNRDIELACDESVVRDAGETIRSLYALTLIELEEKKFRLAPLSTGFSMSATEERIVSIMKTTKLKKISIIFAVLLIMLTSAVFMTEASVKVPNMIGNTHEDMQQILEDNNLTYIIQGN